jgi:hypothetical protein
VKRHWITNCPRDQSAKVMRSPAIHLSGPFFVGEPQDGIYHKAATLTEMEYVGIYCSLVSFITDQRRKLAGVFI